MTPSVWWTFLIASLVISVSPGPGAVASMASGARVGFPRGYWTAVGLQAGLVFQIALIAAGLGALLVSSPTTFLVVKWLGAGYLAWLGIRLCLAKPVSSDPAQNEMVSGEGPWAQVLRGFFVNCGNPKAIVFMLAVLPQFVTVSQPQLPQYGLMALTMVAVDLVVMAVYTFLGAALLKWLASPSHRRWVDRAFGVIFIAGAIILAVR